MFYKFLSSFDFCNFITLLLVFVIGTIELLFMCFILLFSVTFLLESTKSDTKKATVPFTQHSIETKAAAVRVDAKEVDDVKTKVQKTYDQSSQTAMIHGNILETFRHG